MERLYLTGPILRQHQAIGETRWLFFYSLLQPTHVPGNRTLLHNADAEKTCPFPRGHLSHGFRGRYAERGIPVHDFDADLDRGNLSAKVASQEALAQQFHALHFPLHGFGGGIRSGFARSRCPGIWLPAGPCCARWRSPYQVCLVWHSSGGGMIAAAPRSAMATWQLGVP